MVDKPDSPNQASVPRIFLRSQNFLRRSGLKSWGVGWDVPVGSTYCVKTLFYSFVLSYPLLQHIWGHGRTVLCTIDTATVVYDSASTTVTLARHISCII